MWSGDQGLNDQEYVGPDTHLTPLEYEDPEVVIALLKEEQEDN